MFPLQDVNSKKRKRVSSKSGDHQNLQNETINGNCKLRKLMHRDVERQRRQEMATLYASLRDLLPLEYIKGKRAISDHMHGAVNYIKQMEGRIKELRMRKDELKNSYKDGISSNIGTTVNCVTVNSSCDGTVEILINCAVKEGKLSRVMMELLQEQLDVLTCISTKADQRILYRIHSQVHTLAYINLPELQNRLANVIIN